jgi:riboflavin biosynthesis pyrimidine reductase
VKLLWPTAQTLDDDALVGCYRTDRARSWLRANFVTTLDGAAEVGGYSRGVGGGASDQRVLKLLREQADAVVVGAGTLRHEGYTSLRLNPEAQARRVDQGLAPQPTLVIVSNALDLPDRLFADAPVRPIVLTHAGAPAERVAALAAVTEVIWCGESVVDLRSGIAELRHRGFGQLLTEGGPHLFGDLLAAELIDELCLTVSPLLAGSGATRIVSGPSLPAPQRMRLAHVIAGDDDVLLTRAVRAAE